MLADTAVVSQQLTLSCISSIKGIKITNSQAVCEAVTPSQPMRFERVWVKEEHILMVFEVIYPKLSMSGSLYP